MLKRRQRDIMQDLQKTKAWITAKALAKKYDVSLRTVRNDIDEIALAIKDVDATFIRLPRVGMRIVADESLHRKIDIELKAQDFARMESEVRHLLLLYAFLFLPSPITLEYCCDFFAVSKGTMFNEIKELNHQMEYYDVKLKGIKNKGYFLVGKELDITALLVHMTESMDTTLLHSSLFTLDDAFVDATTRKVLQDLLLMMSNHLSWTIDNYRLAEVWFGIFILRNRNKNHQMSYEIPSSTAPKLKKLLHYMQIHFQIAFFEEDLDTLKFILTRCTDYAEDHDELETTDQLKRAVEAMLQKAVSLRPELTRDLDNLKIDILKHLKCSHDRSKLKLPNTNPLLKQIKMRYLEIFNLALESSKELEKVYPLRLDEDEIGFLTLYFCRSLEKAQQIQEASVMVVCNTGRGASKLLSTRIMNNFPEVHIVAMSSYIDLEKKPEMLDNVDLVISTIPLPDIDKPYVIVSPFLTEMELSKVREAIWIGRQSHGPIQENGLNEMVNSLIHQYVDYKDALEFSKKLDSLIHSQDKSVVYIENEEESELYAEISIEVFNMMTQLSPKGWSVKQCSQVSGLLAHVLMSVPRWLKGNFIQSLDFDQMKKEHPKQYQIIMEFIHTMEKKLEIFIDPVEAIAILRYLTI